jgi:hypothetical protein
MFILGDHGDAPDPVSRQILGNIQSIYDRWPEGRECITIRGPRHFNFSDQVLLKDRYLSRMLGALGPMDQRRGLVVTAACVRTFFDVHLKSAPAIR